MRYAGLGSRGGSAVSSSSRASLQTWSRQSSACQEGRRRRQQQRDTAHQITALTSLLRTPEVPRHEAATCTLPAICNDIASHIQPHSLQSHLDALLHIADGVPTMATLLVKLHYFFRNRFEDPPVPIPMETEHLFEYHKSHVANIESTFEEIREGNEAERERHAVELAALKQDVAREKGDIVALKDKVSKEASGMAALAEENSMLKRCVYQMHRERSDAKQVADTRKDPAEVRQLLQCNETLSADINTMQQEHKALENTIADNIILHEEKLRESQNSELGFRRMCAMAKNQCRQLTNDVIATREENSSLKQRLHDTQDEVLKLNETLQSTTTQLAFCSASFNRKLHEDAMAQRLQEEQQHHAPKPPANKRTRRNSKGTKEPPPPLLPPPPPPPLQPTEAKTERKRVATLPVTPTLEDQTLVVPALEGMCPLSPLSPMSPSLMCAGSPEASPKSQKEEEKVFRVGGSFARSVSPLDECVVEGVGVPTQKQSKLAQKCAALKKTVLAFETALPYLQKKHLASSLRQLSLPEVLEVKTHGPNEPLDLFKTAESTIFLYEWTQEKHLLICEAFLKGLVKCNHNLSAKHVSVYGADPSIPLETMINKYYLELFTERDVFDDKLRFLHSLRHYSDVYAEKQPLCRVVQMLWLGHPCSIVWTLKHVSSVFVEVCKQRDTASLRRIELDKFLSSMDTILRRPGLSLAAKVELLRVSGPKLVPYMAVLSAREGDSPIRSGSPFLRYLQSLYLDRVDALYRVAVNAAVVTAQRSRSDETVEVVQRVRLVKEMTEGLSKMLAWQANFKGLRIGQRKRLLNSVLDVDKFVLAVFAACPKLCPETHAPEVVDPSETLFADYVSCEDWTAACIKQPLLCDTPSDVRTVFLLDPMCLDSVEGNQIPEAARARIIPPPQPASPVKHKKRRVARRSVDGRGRGGK